MSCFVFQERSACLGSLDVWLRLTGQSVSFSSLDVSLRLQERSASLGSLDVWLRLTGQSASFSSLDSSLQFQLASPPPSKPPHNNTPSSRQRPATSLRHPQPPQANPSPLTPPAAGVPLSVFVIPSRPKPTPHSTSCRRPAASFRHPQPPPASPSRHPPHPTLAVSSARPQSVLVSASCLGCGAGCCD